MAHYRFIFMGFGNVGQALARLLLRKQAELEKNFQITFRVTGISTGSHGNAVNPDGIDLTEALMTVQGGNSLDPLSIRPVGKGSDFLSTCEGDVFFENTPVSYQDGEPARTHIKTALELGMHAITANKGPVVHAYNELNELARQNNRHFYFEATVMDGAPIFSLFRHTLPAANLKSFSGILNSTTNLILSRMETGETFAEAVAYAQKIGIAETDPSGDVDGWDAAIKVAALVTVLMGTPLKPSQVRREGIRSITWQAVNEAAKQNKRWKLVCSAERHGAEVAARVAPQLVSADSPLYSVEGTSSIIEFHTDVLGPLSVLEANPGTDTTAYGLFADFLNAVRTE